MTAVKPFRALFLDDMEERHTAFTNAIGMRDDLEVHHVRTAAEAIAALQRLEFDQAYLDHDLSIDDIMVAPDAPSREPTAMAVAEHIMTMTAPPATVVVHSCNPPAAAAMARLLRSHPQIEPWRVHELPFPLLIGSLRAGRRTDD